MRTDMARVKITQTISRIGSTKNQRANLDALGLHKIGQTVEHDDSKIILGMLTKVKHLVKFEIVESAPAKKAAPKKEEAPKAEEPKAEVKAEAAAEEPKAEKPAAKKAPVKKAEGETEKAAKPAAKKAAPKAKAEE